ncbi:MULTISPECIES: hypothetical protein [Pseudomonas]|jgi:hypothetical protein|uniref:Uncharacterized protein n=1 Tax=Pseudomonas umsongensis TaxID=198618 RepID=A0ACC5MIJ6_9PSED|nr:MULTISPECIES: hypothetical protein [Pseudomonas]MBB2888511.1 hypothetical protein [Pseudomonas umsongensis]NMN76067.1 hypothetical protein [Pseudomonas sp. KD5]WLG44229.1 hypothetical protein PSH69_25820 [Pseudomonas sp. FP1740]CAH0190229.1 hypothetical protein SRABI123_01664 [Pseudomonas sp. Bi123]GID06751.1 hypothetical protein TMM008_39530 [Pseudomonas sp. 008]
MNEQILNMSGDFDRDFEAYQSCDKDNIEAMGTTILDCGTLQCTGLGCSIP